MLLLKAMDFDTEKFINEIRNRPTIWNSKCPDYVDRELKLQAWNELVDQYAGDEALTREERKRVCVHLQKKWRNIRDCFVKTHKARTKPGSDKKKVTQYAFYDHLMFLADIASSKDSNNVINVAEIKNEVIHNDDDDPLSVVHRVFKKKKIEIQVDPFSDGDSSSNKRERTQERESDSNTEDEDQLFCLSLVKEFRKIPDHLRIQAKIDILKVIKDAQFAEWTGHGTDPQYY
ncbi:uncharacterized protein LOC134676533 [Cydia fagiglandana]|uniref:uncharacterized protein LOC134676533 n=1 Tax=Cydia fagiglandana TaxID=1458189 RepID=UPI002FEDEB11